MGLGVLLLHLLVANVADDHTHGTTLDMAVGTPLSDLAETLLGGADHGGEVADVVVFVHLAHLLDLDTPIRVVLALHHQFLYFVLHVLVHLLVLVAATLFRVLATVVQARLAEPRLAFVALDWRLKHFLAQLALDFLGNCLDE